MNVDELRQMIDLVWSDLKQAQREQDVAGQERACAAANRYERLLTAELAKQGHRGALSVLRYREKAGVV